jgi:hypothetical protein
LILAKGKREELSPKGTLQGEQDDSGCMSPSKPMSAEEKRLFDKGLQKIDGVLYPLGEQPYISVEGIKKLAKSKVR